LAFHAQVVRCKVSVCDPDVPRAGDRAHLFAPRAQSFGEPFIVYGYMTEDQVAVARCDFCVGGERKIRAKRQRLLAKTRWRGVVHGNQRSGLARNRSDGGYIAHVEIWIAGSLEPYQLDPA